MQDTQSPLAGLLKAEEYQQRTSNLFPGIESLRWYIRQHRPALTADGALLYIAGRLWINPPKFDGYVLAAGAKQREAA